MLKKTVEHTLLTLQDPRTSYCHVLIFCWFFTQSKVCIIQNTNKTGIFVDSINNKIINTSLIQFIRTSTLEKDKFFHV